MPTTNPRINITLEPNVVKVLTDLAQSKQVSVASLSKELIFEALERREDLALSSIAKLRDTKNAKTVGHDDAWS